MNEKERLIQNINTSMPIVQQIVQAQNEIDKLEERIEKNSGFWKGMKVAAIISAVILALAIVLIIGGEKPDLSLLYPIPFIVVYILHMKKIRGIRAQIEPFNKKIAELWSDPALEWLPHTYKTTYCFFKIAEYVNNNRVDNLREAINLIEEDIHRLNMREAAALGAYLGSRDNNNNY